MKTDIALNEDVLARPEQDVAERLRFWRRSLSKHKWPALGLALLVIAVAAYKVYTETPLYSATSTILIESDKPKVVSIEEVYSGIGTNRDQLHTQGEGLKAASLHKKLVGKLGLHKQAPPKKEEQPVTKAEW